jgi:hypothetical protein
MEGQAHGREAEVTGEAHERQDLVARGAELAGQRPVGAGGLDDQADVDLRAGGMLGDLLELFLGVGGEKRDAGGMGEGDVGGAFHRVAEGHRLGTCAERQAKLDLPARGGVEMGAEVDQTLDDLARGVRLHGIVDIGAAKARLQAAILRLDGVDIEHQRRALEGLRTDEGLDPGRGAACGRDGKSRREIGERSVHGHLQ